jgi:hypothetical protein
MQESCETCRTNVNKSIETAAADMKRHHEDEAKHVSPDSRTILGDILSRVMRIEGKMFNGHGNS